MEQAAEQRDAGERTVERVTVLDADLDRAWETISDSDEMERWLADEVDLEPIEGSPARFSVDGEDRAGRVERVREGRELSFTWERERGRASLVELQLTPLVRGVRLRISETELGSGPQMSGHAWDARLTALSSRFALVAA